MWHEIQETKANMAKHIVITFTPFIALATLVAVRITTVELDTYDVENATGKPKRCRIHLKNSSR